MKRFLSRDHKNTLLLFNTTLCFILLATRIAISGSILYLFLVWNLFLAAIPWLISNTLVKHPQLHSKKWVVICAALLWVLFFPNAPYILTDLFHLSRSTTIPRWYDLLLLLAASWTGLLFGFVSIRQIDTLVRHSISAPIRITAITLLFFISGFGIYLGRYLRWNSWDIISSPAAFFRDILHIVFNPAQNVDSYGMTIVFGLLLSGIYWSIHLFNDNKNNTQKI